MEINIKYFLFQNILYSLFKMTEKLDHYYQYQETFFIAENFNIYFKINSNKY
jgi:hypothetical protein